MPVRSTLSRDVKEIEGRVKRWFPKRSKSNSEIVVEEVKKRTPKGKIIDPETGLQIGVSTDLYDSVLPIVPRQEGDTWVSGAWSDNDHAHLVEKGTRAHDIGRPGQIGVLRYWSGGALYYRQRVHHPGTLGKHMFALGLAAADSRIQGEGQAELDVIYRV